MVSRNSMCKGPEAEHTRPSEDKSELNEQKGKVGGRRGTSRGSRARSQAPPGVWEVLSVILREMGKYCRSWSRGRMGSHVKSKGTIIVIVNHLPSAYNVPRAIAYNSMNIH